MKVLYLYSGSRKDKFKGAISIDFPDTQYYGLNHFAEFGITAEYKEFGDLAKSFRWGSWLGFRVRHLMMYKFIQGYDIVFGSSLLYLAPFKKIFKPKTKFVLFNIGINRTLFANRHNKFKFFLLQWFLKEMDGIVCLARSQKEDLEKQLPFLRGRIFFVPLGVDTLFYKPTFDRKGDYYLAVGRDNGRDYKSVVAAARLLPHMKFEIFCSRRNISGIDIPQNVSVTYDAPFSTVYKKYQEAKALLLITHDDTYLDGADCSGQTVLLDAMASGLPIIASRKKYLGDYVIDKEEALLVDFYNPRDIVLAINVLNNASYATRMAKAARAKAEKKFSTKQMARQLACVFQSVLQEKI